MDAIGAAGRFAALDPVGDGETGLVYAATDTVDGRPVAVKVMRVPAGATRQEAVLRFRHEYRTRSRQRHPSLCGVQDLGTLPDDRPYYAMDLLTPLGATSARAILTALAGAVGYLHRQGLIHGDIRPARIGVTHDGSIKLRLPAALHRPGEPAQMPPDGLAFVAPEAWRDASPDQRADIFALGATVRALSGGSDLDAETERVLRGMTAPEPAARYQTIGDVLGALGQPVDLASGTPVFASRFVGCATQLEAFSQTLQALVGGRQDQAFWVVGGSGAGKSRFLAECRALARQAGVTFLGGTPDHGAPYGHFTSILRRLVARSPGTVEALTPEQRASLGRLLPDLRREVDRVSMEPQDERVALLAAIAHVILAAAGESGVVISLDDWDRADPGSVAALAYLRRNAHHTRLLVLGTMADRGDLAGEHVQLPPLDPDEVAEMAGSMLGHTAVPTGFAAALHRWTAGNPGHLRLTVDHLARTGALRSTDGRPVFPADLTVADVGADFQAMVLAPLEGLPDAARRLAESLAVLGEEADLAMVAVLTGLDDESLFTAMDELWARRLLVVREGRLSLTSRAIEEAVYAAVDPERRLTLHASVATELEERLLLRSADAASQTALARHLLYSRQTDRALSAAFLAADFNMDIFAVGTARDLLRDGLALMDQEPGHHDHWRCAFLGRLAAVERWRGDFTAMGVCLDEAIPLAERLREHESLGRLLVLQGAFYNQQMTTPAFRKAAAVLQRAISVMAAGSLFTQTRCRYFLGQAYFYLGQTTDARGCFEEAAAIAETANLPFWKAKSLAFLGFLTTTGDPATRETGFQMLAEAAAIQTRLGDRYGRGFTAALHGEALVKAFRLAEAEAEFQAQVASSSELGVVEDLATGLTNLAIVQALAGQYRAARRTCEQAIEVGDRSGQPVVLLARAVDGWVAACQGDLNEAETLLQAAEAAAGGGDNYMFTHAAPVLLAGWLRLGRLDEMRRLGQEALFAFRSFPDRDVESQVWALLGEAHARMGESDTGSDYTERAWRAAQEGGYPLARCLAARSRALLALQAGRADDARLAADEALAIAVQAGATGLVADANGLLGDALLALGVPGGQGCFDAMLAFADQEGLPFLRALARYGLARVASSADQAEALNGEARHLVQTMAAGLAPQARDAFLGLREVVRVLGTAGAVAPAAPVAHAGRRQADDALALARALNALETPTAVLAYVATVARERVQGDHAVVVLQDPGSEAGLRRRAVSGRPGVALPATDEYRIPCSQAIETGRSASWPALAQGASRPVIVCVPVTVGNRPIGALGVMKVAGLLPDDVQALAAWADQAAMAVAFADLAAGRPISD